MYRPSGLTVHASHPALGRAVSQAVQDGAPQNTNQMGGELPVFACSILTLPLLTVPRKGSLWASDATELASLHSHAGSAAACKRCRTAMHACMRARVWSLCKVTAPAWELEAGQFLHPHQTCTMSRQPARSALWRSARTSSALAPARRPGTRAP